ncbi:MAG: hypothetical protein COX02_00235 [Candidatus Vogelbacteria bacterium CG22_combo_CG10-13_8_21_14_all_37_9]|uniref:Lactamase n=1 Tax=Candidatus Vogelbacteria bacterium CG22_combo_CG10-13_8_21_14_all_37_9 TaxID=1975046 RepID=A0A2H0BL92_9BACT|nr:MAG: hypothetical protein BK005_02245 [bacterium CG10_37_50]PIP58447.1 MAG: hypothetical protein COX02_00235 [Candidatus Vogelbacteria bacterium CG22_combo_CG10-13_8_21_14_all_37_9]
MIVSYFGQAFIKVQLGDLTLAFNPISKEADLKLSRFGADIAFVSSEVPEANGVESVTYANKTPFVINGPGEYEREGIFVRGFASEGEGASQNTIYTLTIDNISICHLGLLKNPNLPTETVEELGSIDLLFVPIGDGPVLSPKEAAKLATSLEPKMIVPIMIDLDDGTALKNFLKEVNGEVKPIDKLTIKRKDLESKEEVVVLKADN